MVAAHHVWGGGDSNGRYTMYRLDRSRVNPILAVKHMAPTSTSVPGRDGKGLYGVAVTMSGCLAYTTGPYE